MQINKDEGILVRVQGIPCLAYVTGRYIVKPWKGSVHTCPSSDDWYGCDEIEFDIYDSKGYRAMWLEKKMTPIDVENIEEAIREYESTLCDSEE